MMASVAELQRQIRKGVKDIFGLETREQDDLLTKLLTFTPRQLQHWCMQAHVQGPPRCTKEDADFFVDLLSK